MAFFTKFDEYLSANLPQKKIRPRGNSFMRFYLSKKILIGLSKVMDDSLDILLIPRLLPVNRRLLSFVAQARSYRFIIFWKEIPVSSAKALAVALAQSLVTNHAFVDGNKRIGTLSMIVFLMLNGYRLKMTNDELLQFIINDVITQKITRKGISANHWGQSCEKNNPPLRRLHNAKQSISPNVLSEQGWHKVPESLS